MRGQTKPAELTSPPSSVYHKGPTSGQEGPNIATFVDVISSPSFSGHAHNSPPAPPQRSPKTPSFEPGPYENMEVKHSNVKVDSSLTPVIQNVVSPRPSLPMVSPPKPTNNQGPYTYTQVVNNQTQYTQPQVMNMHYVNHQQFHESPSSKSPSLMTHKGQGQMYQNLPSSQVLPTSLNNPYVDVVVNQETRSEQGTTAVLNQWSGSTGFVTMIYYFSFTKF